MDIFNHILEKHKFHTSTLLHLTRILINFYKMLRDITNFEDLIEFVIYREADKIFAEDEPKDGFYVAKYHILIEDYFSSREELIIIVDSNIEKMKKLLHYSSILYDNARRIYHYKFSTPYTSPY